MGIRNKKYKVKIILVFVFLVSLFFSFGGDALAQVPCFDAVANPSMAAKYPPAQWERIGGACVPLAATVNLSDRTFFEVFSSIAYWLLTVLSVLGILAFIIAGYQYMTAGGDEKQIETAKRNIKWSIIGIAVALSSLIIIATISYLIIDDTNTF